MPDAVKTLQAIQRKREIDKVIKGDYDDYSCSDVDEK